MKFAALALVAAASVATADAQYPACNASAIKNWIGAAACTKDTNYTMLPPYLPNATTYEKFCKSKNCETAVILTLAARPNTTDCTYKVQGQTVNFFEMLVDASFKACGFSITQAPPTAAPTTPPPATTQPPATTPPPTSSRPAC